MQFVNLTPHQIVLRLLQTDAAADIVIPPSGTVARRATIETSSEPINGIPTIVRRFGPVEGLPEPQADTVYIVSALVLEGCTGREDVMAPDTGPSAIRKDGQVVAVTRLVRPPTS